MASKRFLKLERDPGAGAEAAAELEPDAAPLDVAGRARSLEREGQIRLDEAPLDTDFCHACRFENRAGMGRCMNCGSPLGGAEQEAFDEEMRARRDAEREARAAEAGAAGAQATTHHADAGEAAQAAAHVIADLDVAKLLREAERHEPGFGTVIGSGVLVACIFALVSIPLRRIFGGPGAGGAFELLLLVAITAAIYAGVRRKLEKL